MEEDDSEQRERDGKKMDFTKLRGMQFAGHYWSYVSTNSGGGLLQFEYSGDDAKSISFSSEEKALIRDDQYIKGITKETHGREISPMEMRALGPYGDYYIYCDGEYVVPNDDFSRDSYGGYVKREVIEPDKRIIHISEMDVGKISPECFSWM